MSSHAYSKSVESFCYSVNAYLKQLADNLKIKIKIDMKNPPALVLRELLHLAHLKSGKQVVVIIDEYDKPILDLL